MATHLNGTNIPAWCYQKGSSIPERAEIVGVDGEGMDIVAGYAAYVFSWDWVSYSEYAFWQSTLLAGAASLKLTSAVLYDHTPAEHTYTEGILHAPTYEKFNGGEVLGVKVRIDRLK